jgi:hypothetical protein
MTPKPLRITVAKGEHNIEIIAMEPNLQILHYFSKIRPYRIAILLSRVHKLCIEEEVIYN